MSFILRIIPPTNTPLDLMSPLLGEIDQITSDVFQDRPITSALRTQALETLQRQFPTYVFRFEEKPDLEKQASAVCSS